MSFCYFHHFVTMIITFYEACSLTKEECVTCVETAFMHKLFPGYDTYYHKKFSF